MTKEISKEEYLSECAKGLEILGIATCGSGNASNVGREDLLMVTLCKPGEIEPHVSYSRLRDVFVFSRGYPITAIPLNP